MRIRELLHDAAPITVRADDSLEQAARLMVSRGVRHLPVVEDDRLLGMLSERDLLAFHGYGGLKASVRGAMAFPVETASLDDDVAAVASRMVDRKIGCLPIVTNGKVLGVISTTDLLALHARTSPPSYETGFDGFVRDAMTRNPEVAHPDDYLLDAVGRLSRLGVRHLPVVDGDNRVLGMLSDRDVRQAVGDLQIWEGERGVSRRFSEQRVMQVASLSPMTISQDAPLSEAIHRFVDHRIGALAAVDEAGHLLGILSYVDVLRYLADRIDAGTSARPERGEARPALH